MHKDLMSEAQKLFTQEYVGHGWDHTERVLATALHIGKEEGADLEILAIAAILHDIGRDLEEKANGKICHAEKGAEMARGFLSARGFSEEKISAICHCIECHRYRKAKPPQTLEAKILFDADKLDSVGAIGLGRAFMFAGKANSMLHNPNMTPKRAEMLETLAVSKEDTAYKEFVFKLSHIKTRMLTRIGKKIAEDRHVFMQQFFDRMNDEVEGKL